MRTLDDLRLSFEQHADLAGDTRGLVQAAREGAVRIRRRRRVVRAAVSAAVVAVLAVVVPVVATRDLAQRPVPATPAAPAAPVDRRLGQVTIDLDAGSGYAVRSLTTLADRQEMTAVPVAARDQADSDPTIQVVVFEPGVFNAGPLPGTEPVTVAGQDAWFQPAFPLGRLTNWPADDARGPAIGWPERSGAQVVVYRRPESDMQRAELLRVAQGLRIGPPRDVTVPFRLGWIPAGMEITGVAVRPRSGDTNVALRRGDDRVTLWAVPKSHTPAGSFRGPGFTPLTVAGRPAVRQAEAKYHRLIIPEFGTCGLFIETAGARDGSGADFVRMLETLTVADCEDRKTWTRPVR